jgi:hypothetical protein
MLDPSQPNAVERYKQLVEALLELESLQHFDRLQKYIAGAAAKLCNSDEAWLFFPDQTNRTLNLERDSFGSEDQYREVSLSMDSSLEGWVLTNQQPVLINDANGYDHRMGELISLTGTVIKGALIVPMTVNGKQVGVL